jgi:hypothetical protein
MASGKQIKLARSLHTLLEKHPPIIRMEVPEHEYLDVADIEAVREANLTLSEGKPFCVLLDTSHGYFNVSPKANKLLASKKYSEKRMAAALVVKSLASRLAGNFFLRLKPGSPTRLFLTEREAVNWLRTFAKD